jgi:sulfur carrier protein
VSVPDVSATCRGDACPPADRIALVVNGENHIEPLGSTVAELLGRLNLAGAAVAVEVNRALVPRARHASTALGDGDRVEIVTLVGGG